MKNNYQKMMKILTRAAKSILPPKKQLPADWVENNLVFPDGELQGQRVKLFAFQHKPINDIVNPRVRKVVLMSSAQLLKTTVLQNSMYYFLANDPSNMIFGGATGGTTSKFRTGKWQAVIEACPVLKNLVSNKNDKNYTNNDKTQQNLDGTFTYFLSLGSSASLRGLSSPRVFLDEISNVDADGDEGNPLKLAEQRTKAFSNPLIMCCSTPLDEHDLITQQYEQSNKQKFYVPCPHCNHSHELVFDNVKFDWKIIEGGRRRIPDADTARLECPKCSNEITEAERVRMIRRGEWVVTAPEVTDIMGYHISRLYSPINSIKSIVADFAEAHYTFDLASFYNNVLGLPYIDKENTDHDLVLLENLRDSEIDINTVPDDCQGIVFGVDQQLDRLEVTTLGVSEKNLYVLDHRSIYAIDCTKIEAPAWNKLTAFANTPFKTKSGKPLKVLAGFVDSSNGNATSTVYRYCSSSTIFKPIKGGTSNTNPLFKGSTAGGHSLINLNVNLGKSNVRQLLNRAVSDSENSKEVQIHFSHSVPDDYFIQLTSEKRVIKAGAWVWVKKVSSARNETLDCLNYSLICFQWYLSKLGSQPFRQLREYNAKQKEKAGLNKEVNTEEAPTKPTPKRVIRPRKGGGFFK
ncbi:phage terminase large subunit family protein [Escherichia coli]|nr:terminase [Escherichia coli]EHT7058296.1 phage terminase large subunit family protein [Escherichia coli]EKG8199150.1 phage terminase large subunit family protein [Escherichia coli]HAU8218620.1 terminase [Escherichia coli]HAW1865054.1 terminase [Escherichia coli]